MKYGRENYKEVFHQILYHAYTIPFTPSSAPVSSHKSCGNKNNSFTPKMCFSLSASDWLKLLIIFMSYLRVRVIRNNSLTSTDVRLKACSGIEAELRREENRGFKQGDPRFTIMNGEY